MNLRRRTARRGVEGSDLLEAAEVCSPDVPPQLLTPPAGADHALGNPAPPSLPRVQIGTSGAAPSG